MKTEQTRKKRLAAIDMDGTLLGPTKEVSAENLEALARLREAGFHVVVASGRHHLNLLPLATSLPGVDWLVSSQGAEVADLLRRTSIYQAFLDESLVRFVLDIGRRHGFSAVVYAREGVFAIEDGKWVDFYAGLSGVVPTQVTAHRLFQRGIFKVLWLGDQERIESVAQLAELEGLAAYRVQTHEYIVEFLSREASKALGTAALARHLGVDATDVVAFGDGENDIPLFQWAGNSVAMPHGWPEAKRFARMVASEGAPETAFARGVEMVLAGVATESRPVGAAQGSVTRDVMGAGTR